MFIVPGVYRCTLYDANGVFTSTDNVLSYLFNPSFGDFAKEALVTLKLNGNVEFIGNIQRDSIEYDLGQRTVTFVVDPQTGVLNDIPLFGIDGQTPYNQLGWTANTWHATTEILEKIYQQVSTAISIGSGTLSVRSDWVFKGVINGGSTWRDDILFSEVYQWIDSLFLLYGYGVTSMGDLLRKMALDWGGFTGLIHKEKAFFHRLRWYDANNTQALATVLARKLSYRWPELVGAQVRLAMGDGQFAYTMAGEFSTHTYTYYVRDLALVSFFASTPAFTTVAGVLARGQGYDGTYWVHEVSQPNTTMLSGAFAGYGLFLASWYLWNRADFNACRVDTFTVAGVGMDFLKCFTDEFGGKYQIIGMKKKIAASSTDIDAIYLGT
jgi:hypothetical protein